MSKKVIFSETLGLTQDEMALLFGITRSQWVMFLHHKRDLPGPTKVLLGRLMKCVQDVSLTKSNDLPIVAAQKAEIPKVIHQLLQENALKQMKFQKKIQRAERQFEGAKNTLHLLEVLHAQNETLDGQEKVLAMIKNNAVKKIKISSLPSLAIYKHKLEVLQQEETLLKSKLAKQ